MVSVDPENLLHGVKFSSVVPSKVTGETAIHELSNMDLAMKLHYLRSVYYYKKEAIEGLDMYAFKKPMFRLLDVYSPAAGRIRRSDTGRPLIKCNDSGVRIFEAQCNMTLDEWLEKKDLDQSLHKHLVPDRVLGPELSFSPLVFFQITKFKCGGIAIGFSWAHVLGDPFTASKFINMWAHLLAGSSAPQAVHLPRTNTEKTAHAAGKPLSARPVEPVRDHWLTANNCKMELRSFHIADTQLKHLESKISDQTAAFEAVSALIWHCIAKIRGARGPKIVTVCRNGYHDKDLFGVLSNDQIISTVEADFCVAETEISELAALIANGKKDETGEIEAMVDNDNGSPDLIVYGANLTFVNLEEIDLYGLQLKGQKPVSAFFAIDGVGEEGVVLVLREPLNSVTVTIIIPEKEIGQLRDTLERDWRIT